MNIGPWWIYDTIILIILISSTIYGGWKGFFGVIYFLLGEAIILLILFIISKLIVNLIDTQATSYVYKHYDIESLFNFITNVENSVLSKIDFSGSGKAPTFTDKGIIPTFINFFISETIWGIVFLVLWFILSIVLLILYITVFSRKKIKFHLNKYVRITLGSLFGFCTGLLFAYPIYVFASFPLLQNSSLEVATTTNTSSDVQSEEETYSYIVNGNYGTILEYIENSIEQQENSNETKIKSTILKFNADTIIDKLKNWANGTNSFNDHAISSKMYSTFRMSKNYLYNGLAKYIVQPLITLIQNTKDNFDFDKLKDKLQHIDDVIVKGYCETSIKNIPISYWIELLPSKARQAVRMLIESFLDIAAVSSGHVSYVDSTGEDGNRSGFSSMYYLNQELRTYTSSHGNKRLDKEGFIKFYNSNSTNQFIIARNNMKKEGEDNRYIYEVLGNPSKLYEFLKNVYEINNAYSSPGSFPFLPNVYTSLFLVRGMEIVPSGDYFKGVFGMDNGTDIIHGTKYFVLANYLDFIDKEYMS